MKKLFTLFFAVAICATNIWADDEPDYKKWPNEFVHGIYEEVTDIEAIEFGFDEAVEQGFTTHYFVSVTPVDGVYEITVGENIGERMWRIQLNDYFMKVSMTSMLIYGDEGVLEWNGTAGFFYKKPRTEQ